MHFAIESGQNELYELLFDAGTALTGSVGHDKQAARQWEEAVLASAG